MTRRQRLPVVILAWLLSCLAGAPAHGWDAARLAVPVVVDDLVSPYPEFAIYLAPGQPFQVSFGEAGTHGRIRFAGPGRFALQTPRRHSSGSVGD